MILIAIALSQADAREQLGKVEARYVKAKTLQVVCAMTITGEKAPMRAEIELLMGEGNKFKYVFKGVQGEGERETRIESFVVCDGEKIIFSDDGKVSMRAAPKDLGRSVRIAFARMGASSAGMQAKSGGIALPELVDIEYGPNPKTIRYVWALNRSRQLTSVIDPESLQILSIESAREPQKIREEYSLTKFDQEIPDGAFQPPQPGEAARRHLAAFRSALGMFEVDTGRFPTTEEGLAALLVKPASVKGWKGPYLDAKSIPKDPWGRDYLYRFPGQKDSFTFDLKSAGPDAKEGTADDVEK